MESVAEQDFNSYELIIINDGSTDDTLQKIKSVKSRFTNFKLISYPVNKGVNYARNRGIEKAVGKYIIFLDSDDTLTTRALFNIEKTISQNPDYSHYMFCVSDRINDITLPNEMHEYQYPDWLLGKVSGDFAHVIHPLCFEGLMFNEEFRIYEFLNWLRVLRQNKKQLYIPKVVMQRERNREDSVTRESSLDNKNSMQNNYNYIHLFIDWYRKDFETCKLSEILQAHIKKGFLLGLALGETSRNNELIKQMKCSENTKKVCKIVNKPYLSPLFYRMIQVKSKYNQIKRKQL
jgi:glycosyltransferase involved in cell wall biosynthesis